MSKITTQINCLKRFSELTAGIDEILLFLLEEKLVKEEVVKGVRSAPLPSKEMQALLSNLYSDGKLQMLEYNWTLLPVESINITIVTDTTKREFSYSSH